MAKLLVVGPRRLTRQLANSLAGVDSFSIMACSSLRALMRRLRAHVFHATVADWLTCGRSGVAALAQAHIPIILISGPKHLAEAYRLAKAVEVVLETPVKDDELRTLVTTLAKHGKAPKQQRSSVEQPPHHVLVQRDRASTVQTKPRTAAKSAAR